MSTPENTFIASVHRYLPEAVYHMKNHNQYNGGIPDVWYSGPKSDLWVEYKFIQLPKRESTLISCNLSHLQQDWLKRRAREGRHVAVIIGSKDGGVWLPHTTWEQPLTAQSFRGTMVPRAALAGIILGQVQ